MRDDDRVADGCLVVRRSGSEGAWPEGLVDRVTKAGSEEVAGARNGPAGDEDRAALFKVRTSWDGVRGFGGSP